MFLKVFKINSAWNVYDCRVARTLQREVLFVARIVVVFCWNRRENVSGKGTGVTKMKSQESLL